MIVSPDRSDVTDVSTEFDLFGNSIMRRQALQIGSVGTSAVEAQQPVALFPLVGAQRLQKDVLTLACAWRRATFASLTTSELGQGTGSKFARLTGLRTTHPLGRPAAI